MRFTLSSLATAALVLVASAAPTAEITNDLPARFGLTTITAEPRANGLRLQVSENGIQVSLMINSGSRTVDASFVGGRGRIALDLSVHKNPTGNNPPQAGDWNLTILPGVSELRIYSEEFQATLESWGPGYHPTVGTWVVDANGVLRLLDANGALKPNGVRLCGVGTSAYILWWDDVPYLNCPVVEFKVVPL